MYGKPTLSMVMSLKNGCRIGCKRKRPVAKTEGERVDREYSLKDRKEKNTRMPGESYGASYIVLGYHSQPLQTPNASVRNSSATHLSDCPDVMEREPEREHKY